MSLFDKIKNVGKMIQDDVKKIPTDDIKERLADVKNVLSESYSQTKVKLDEKNKTRNLINDELNLLKTSLDYTSSLSDKNVFSNYLNPDNDDILEVYKNKKVRSYEEIKNLNLIKYKGLTILRPKFDLTTLSESFVDVKSVLVNKEVLNFEIEEEVIDADNNLNDSTNKEKLGETETVLGKLEINDANVENLNLESDEATLRDLNIVEEVTLGNIEIRNDVNYYLCLEYDFNFDKLTDLIWKDILVLREKEILELNIKQLVAEKLVESCIICNSENHIDSFIHKDNLICSDKCYKDFKNLVLTLNNSKKGIEEELKLLNNSYLNKKEDNNIKGLFNNLKLNDLKNNNWIVVPNSFILRNEFINGETLYVGYDIICKLNNDGLLEILIYRDLLSKKDLIDELIVKDESYKVLQAIFN